MSRSFSEQVERGASADERRAEYAAQLESLGLILADEHHPTAVYATVACELHHAFGYFDWTGFYLVDDGELVVGPYQGTHGCLRIAFDRGVCGAAARTRTTQFVPDVEAFPGHIACSSSTRSEVVVPIITSQGDLLGVLDVDSDDLDAFDQTDVEGLERICAWIASHLQQ
jgi:GAF domain-containing protein